MLTSCIFFVLQVRWITQRLPKAIHEKNSGIHCLYSNSNLTTSMISQTCQPTEVIKRDQWHNYRRAGGGAAPPLEGRKIRIPSMFSALKASVSESRGTIFISCSLPPLPRVRGHHYIFLPQVSQPIVMLLWLRDIEPNCVHVHYQSTTQEQKKNQSWGLGYSEKVLHRAAVKDWKIKKLKTLKKVELWFCEFPLLWVYILSFTCQVWIGRFGIVKTTVLDTAGSNSCLLGWLDSRETGLWHITVANRGLGQGPRDAPFTSGG